MRPLGLVGLALVACSGDSSSEPPIRNDPPSASGAPTRIVFLYPAGGEREFEDNVPIAPSVRYIVRAVPMDAAGKAYAKLTQNWAVSGSGTLDHAVTTPDGGNDPTMNGWTIGPTLGVQSITVSLPAHPGVTGAVHARAVKLQVVAIDPPAGDLTLDLGQEVPLTMQLQTSDGLPFAWAITFEPGVTPYQPCSHYNVPGAKLEPTTTPRSMGPLTIPTDAEGKVTVMLTAPTLVVSDCQPTTFARPALSVSGIQPGGGSAIDWRLVLSPGPPASLVAVSGGGQAASLGATLPFPLVVKVTDTYGNALPGVAVTWAVTSGGGSLDATTTATNTEGTASVHWTVGSTQGNQTVKASISGGLTATFTTTVSP